MVLNKMFTHMIFESFVVYTKKDAITLVKKVLFTL